MRLAAIFAAILMAAACATPIDTYSDYNGSVNFTEYKTFAWAEPGAYVPSGAESDRVNSMVRHRVETDIKQVLANKGFTYVEDASAADFLVAYTVGARDQLDIREVPDYSSPVYARPYPYYVRDYYGYPMGWGTSYNTRLDASTYTEGSLGIDIFDATSKEPAWAGRSTKHIQQSDRDNPGPAIMEVVKSTLGDFPPGM